jgi:hypothetical protein
MLLKLLNSKLKLHFAAAVSVCLISTSAVVSGATPHIPQSDPSSVVFDAGKNAIGQLAPANTRVVVLIFVATDCPISNRYIPEVQRLHQEFVSKGVVIWWVFPNPSDTLSAVRKHEKDFAIDTPTLIDSRQELVRMAHVAVTPEAAVFAVDHGHLREIYHGRIDDRYIAFGQERPQATHHELEEAIQAVLAGRPVPQPVAGPVGCSIIPDMNKP